MLGVGSLSPYLRILMNKLKTSYQSEVIGKQFLGLGPILKIECDRECSIEYPEPD